MFESLRRFGLGRPAPLLRAAPRSPRELLLALRDYDEGQGLDAFLDGIDFSVVSPHQVYYSILGRLPESARVAKPEAPYDARRHFKEALLSPEFQARLIACVTEAFPEKRRLFFVHVPKCAGADLSIHLRQRYGRSYLGVVDLHPMHLLPSAIPGRLKRLVTELEAENTLAVVGHLHLRELLSRGQIRFGDEVVSVVREPTAMVLSMVNFVITHLLSQDSRRTPIIADWLDKLGLGSVDPALDADAARLLALDLLRNPRVVIPNNACEFLGRGDADSAVDLCAAANIELTTVSRYEAWLSERWDVGHSARANESRTFLRLGDLDGSHRAYLQDITREDRRLYEAVDGLLTRSGRTSLSGAELAEAGCR